MIKSFFKIFIAFILIILILFIGFYFWASSSSLSHAQYEIIKNSGFHQEHPSDTLVVMTYNAGYLSGMNNNQARFVAIDTFLNNQRRLIEVINHLSPDIVAFQEIDFDAARSYHGQQLDSVRLMTNLVNTARVVNWDKRYVPFPYWPVSSHFGKIVSGQALASKFPINDNRRIVLRKRLDAPFYYNAFYLDRLIQVNEVTVGRDKLKLMNVHLEAFDSETRMRQAEKVLEVYNELSEGFPVILLGDFNAEVATVGDSTVRTIMKGQNIARAISDSIYHTAPSSYYTYSSAVPTRKIDYIFYSADKIHPLEARVAREFGQISDHLPVVFKFTLK